MKKTVFLKNGPSHNLPKIKYVISEPHEDLLQWNLSWALTFDFLVHQEGGDCLIQNIVFGQLNCSTQIFQFQHIILLNCHVLKLVCVNTILIMCVHRWTQRM